MPDKVMKNNATKIYEFGTYISKVSEDFSTVQEYITQEATDKSGFTGLLYPLQEVMDGLSHLCSEVNREFKSKLDSVYKGLHDTAKQYGDVEKENLGKLSKTGPEH